MTLTPIPHGTTDWDAPLNAQLQQLDSAISGLSQNIKTFGATGDGLTDDSPAIQAAINAAASTGGPVFIPAGTYIIGTRLSIPAVDGLIIQGTGSASSLKLGAGVNDYVMRFTGADTRVTIRDLEIDGNHLQQTAASGGIFANGAVSCRFDNIHFTFCRDDALYLGPQTGGAFGHNNRVIGCLFDQSTGSAGAGRGIHMDSNDENQVEACDFEFLGGADVNAAAIYDQAGTQFILGCNFVNGGNNAKGVWVQNAKSTKIEGCNFDGLSGDNIFLAAQKCVVIGNTLFSPGIAGTAGQASGIYLEFGTSGNVVMGNIITSAPGAGVSRDAIREASDGGGGNNTISYNRIVTDGAWSFGALDLSGTGSRVVGNDGGGQAGDKYTSTVSFFGDTAITQAFGSQVVGDTQVRWKVNTDGTMSWGPGNGSTDATINRSAAGVLTSTAALNGVSFNVNAGTVRAAFLKTTSDTEHAVTIYQAATGTSPGSVALNVISDKPGDSAMFLTGQSSARGTLKIAHLNPGAGATADANASAISIDLQANGKGGTAAQGIFLTSTDGPTTGSLLTFRNNPTPTIEEFAVRSDGKTGIRLPLGNTPQGSLEVRQLNVGDVAMVVQGVASATSPIAQFKNSGGTATLEVGASGAIVTRATAFVTGAMQLGSTSSDLGGSAGAVISMKNATTAPTTNPTGGTILYATGGVLAMRDAAGNVTNFTKQTVTGSRGGNAALASLLTGLATIGLITDSTTA